MKLQEELPVDHHLARVYRYGAAFCGGILLIFGCLGFAGSLSPFDTAGGTVAGMTTNIALSVVSTVIGISLIAGAVVGGNFASTLNTAVGALFLLSGFAHIFVLGRPANILDFGMSNVLFSFVMGLVILTFGMYGRVTSRLSHDNPYWRRRHPRQAARESRNRRRAASSPTSAGEQPVERTSQSPPPLTSEQP
ncbi:DUF4383 domain-containing protein [Streptomyces finlayi]|uniref:DUF4383 domain-containing protein n=1 Tax=Streptomyces finlayi TaxID=67296 RepID=A0A7G7BDJ7_9ACTN|nr:DUF4383 domain-containing protein [Streptomyces finlayi]QNE73412.1 DUF4383 domain-containing protein [Streptomyces finlayi]